MERGGGEVAVPAEPARRDDGGELTGQRASAVLLQLRFIFSPDSPPTAKAHSRRRTTGRGRVMTTAAEDSRRLERADFYVAGPLASLPQIVSGLQAEPGVGARPEALRKPDGHVDRDTRSPVQEVGKCLPCHPEPGGGFGHRQAEWLQTLAADNPARMWRIMHRHVLFPR